LPVYDPLGLVFIIDDDGRVTKSLSLKGHMLRLDRAIERLIPDAAIEVAPMHVVIRALDRFHLPELRNAERGIR
jgi:hypothetical protein